MNPSIVALMVKNEERSLPKTLSSILGKMTDLVVLDTGSSDKTIPLLTTWCQTNQITLHLTEHPFESFDVSRNRLLQFVDDKFPEGSLCLLMDSNDELRGNPFRELKLLKDKQGWFDFPTSAFYIKQEWEEGNRKSTFKTVRMIQVKKGWRYTGSVHEYLMNPDPEAMARLGDYLTGEESQVCLYQNRDEEETKKTQSRWNQDIIMLTNLIQQGKDISRNQFYLGSTYMNLYTTSKDEKSLEQAKECFSVVIKTSYWDEEIFMSKLRLIECMNIQKQHTTGEFRSLCLETFQYSKYRMNHERIEPIVYLIDALFHQDKYSEAWSFSRFIQSIPYPKHAVLFVDDSIWMHKRYHQYSVLCIINQKDFIGGKEANKKACAYRTPPYEQDEYIQDFFETTEKAYHGLKKIVGDGRHVV